MRRRTVQRSIGLRIKKMCISRAIKTQTYSLQTRRNTVTRLHKRSKIIKWIHQILSRTKCSIYNPISNKLKTSMSTGSTNGPISILLTKILRKKTINLVKKLRTITSAKTRSVILRELTEKVVHPQRKTLYLKIGRAMMI